MAGRQSQTKEVKYIQLADGIRHDILSGKLKKGDILPSINAVAKTHGVSRDTVVKAYADLRRRGIIEASHGKGFFVKTEQLKTKLSVLLIFDVINAYKEQLYRGIRENLKQSIATEVYFHHFNSKHLESVIKEQKSNFDLFVVMAWSDRRVYSALRLLPEERTILLDRKVRLTKPGFRFVGQDHGDGFHEALKEAEEKIRAYKRINLVFRDERYHPARIKDAFATFCRAAKIRSNITGSLTAGSVRKGQVYLVIDEEDLVTVVKTCRKKGWELGKDVGLVSYNDTPMMEIIAGGVSVITTDFHQVGKRLAACITKGFNDQDEVLIKTKFISRKTL